jgi:hypothetical protein
MRSTYIEDGADDQYIARNRRCFMTPFEAGAEDLGILREKARARLREPDGDSCQWAQDWLNEYIATTNSEVEQAIGPDLESFRAFQEKVSARISAKFRSGELVPLRCPACSRVMFTPETRQCIWCGHNWRNT